MMIAVAIAAVAAYLALGAVGVKLLNTFKWLAWAEADEAPPHYGWVNAAHPVVVIMGASGAAAMAANALGFPSAVAIATTYNLFKAVKG
jgi:hypothetical protein